MKLLLFCIFCSFFLFGQEIPKNLEEAKKTLKNAYRLELARKYEEAIPKYNLCLQFYTKDAQYTKESLAIYDKIVELEYQLEDYKECLAILERGICIAEQIQHTKYLAKFYEKASQVYQNMANHSKENSEGCPEIEPLKLETRTLVLEIFADGTMTAIPSKVIATDELTQDIFELQSGSNIFPGKYFFQVEASGFEQVSFRDEVRSSPEPYIIHRILVCTGRELELNITGDFPPDEKISPDTITIDGKDASEMKTIPPGKYSLSIDCMGYLPLRDTIEVSVAPGPYVLSKVLVTKPRLIQEKITFDRPPTPQLEPHKITLAPIDNPTMENEIKSGDFVKPGIYKLRIRKEGYITIDEKKSIWASEQPYTICYTVEAKERPIHVTIEYDVEPSTDLEWSISLVAEERASRYDRKKIKPGSYIVEIQQPGYLPIPQQKIYVEPSEDVYKMSVKFVSKPRPISFDVIDEDSRKTVHADTILLNGKSITPEDTFKPGTEGTLVFKFKKFQDILKKVKIVPGEGPVIEKGTMKSLSSREFKARKTLERMIDGSMQPISFAVDNVPVEDIHIEKEQINNSLTIYRVWLDPQVTHLRIYASYIYTQISLTQLEKNGVPTSFSNIDIPRLIQYLDEKGKTRSGRMESLRILERVVRSPSIQRLFRQCANSEIDFLVQQVQLWELPDHTDYMRIREIIDLLDRLKS